MTDNKADPLVVGGKGTGLAAGSSFEPESPHPKKEILKMPKSSEYLNAVHPTTEQDFKLVAEGAEDCFTYHPWTDEEIENGNKVRHALQAAFETVIRFCPPGPDRSTALRKIREARMHANSSITHNGKY